MLVRLGCVLWLCGLAYPHIMVTLDYPSFADSGLLLEVATCLCCWICCRMSLPAFDTAVPNSGFAIRASLPDFLCPGCRSFGSLYLPVVLTSPFVDAALQATGSSHPPLLQAAESSHPPPNYCSDL
ncbi:hypothetical protein TNIN_221561 [Trichonephila inaurata madagascariensis]|uniref:Uncharacterized protein n=1 Tax=Trichonephila inaurata madagascariensis TaxID=2747483 RepID=A0A8X6K7J5_9ARAC|nr:hypothetical protein TNIN_221561 [Trichonephila inaurata madagascariensis]